jgi:N-acetylglucosaminyldiphosphoundecaprenol N-acetyl-beta-D-mannosaminyltransferase
MQIPNYRKVSIRGIKIDDITYQDLCEYIERNITAGKQAVVAYANADTINRSYSNPEIINGINSFDIVHPDGIGIFLASRLLFGRKGFRKRFTGSDFYPYLINTALKNNYSIFFFGGEPKTLSLLKENQPDLIIAGTHEGYYFNDEEVVSAINSANADILVAGLGRGKQEKWIIANRAKLNSKIIIAVGEGIKVFEGGKKRGPVFLRKTGLEWLVRFFFNPIKHFKRYIIGNPLFLCRIITLKLRNLKE